MNDCIEKINDYLRDESVNLPLFVNVENAEQKNILLEHYNVGDNAIVHISDFAIKDGLPNVIKLIDTIKKSQKNTFVFGLTTYLKLISNYELQKTLLALSSMSITKKVVFICFHCDDVFKRLIQKDLRVAQRVITVDYLDEVTKPHITFVAPEFSIEIQNLIDGIEFLPEAIEDSMENQVFVKTSKSSDAFKRGQYAISILNTPLQILQSKFHELHMFSYHKEEDGYWRYLLKLSDGQTSFKSIVISHFSNCYNYEYALQEWNTYDDKLQWLLFIAMKVFPESKNQIIRNIVELSNTHQELMRNIVRAILLYDCKDENYLEIYKQWKSLRKRLNISDEEIADYCEFVDQKGRDALYYLSDLTKLEKEKAIKLIGKYQAEYDNETLLTILKNNFPDFYDYVCPFYFNNSLLDKYFSLYTMQKLRNVIYPEFENLVNVEAEEQHFVELPSRSEIVGSLDKTDSILYFVDALGVEFLNYIQQRCALKGLFAEAKIAKCNLPSITEVNKEFIADFKACNAEIVESIKQIDKVKHEAIGDYNFEKSEYPIHLIDELNTIDKVITNISTKLSSNRYKYAYIISDHGASRLAVIKKSILPIESNRTGTYGGRVCDNNELTKNLPHAVHEGKLCILAGYDRFDGSRPAAVETHGGATLEEVVIPIIKISKNTIVWEFKAMNPDSKVLFSYRTQPILIIWCKNEVSNLTLKLNGKMYNGLADADKKTFRFILDKPEKSCDCIAELYVSSNLVKSDIRFTLEREGVQKTSGFTFGNMKGGSK